MSRVLPLLVLLTLLGALPAAPAPARVAPAHAAQVGPCQPVTGRAARTGVIAHAAAAATYVPDDAYAGHSWAAYQWHLLAVGAPRAWRRAISAGAPGGRGVTIAVLDTGVAYANRPPYRRSPDLSRSTFTAGWDFVDDDPYPNDENGHGTHVASTIAERTGNGAGLAGLAYGARIMPLRVLDECGDGDASDIAAAVRHATRRGVDVINLSLEFGVAVTAGEIPGLLAALRAARAAGILVVGAAGNEGVRAVAFPARSSAVLAVGATTERGCLSDFSNYGPRVDLVAPGGGADAPLTLGQAGCDPEAAAGRPILQLSFERERDPKRFGLPTVYEGTSMAVPQVSATAALAIATGAVGRDPSPARLAAHLAGTARDLGAPGADERYGAGLVDAAAATARRRVTSSG